MKTYDRFKELNIDHSTIGLEQSDTQVTYYCTPKDAEIIGWAGVDGIHYCTIPEFGETIFAVSPVNFGDCVHPIARNFEDLLRMLLHCGGMAALEQSYAWDEEQFKAFLIDFPATEKQIAVLDVIQKEFNLKPMEDAFAYVKKLQSEFDLSLIPYTEDYYDPDMNAAAPQKPTVWKVTWDGGFWPRKGHAGKEIPIGKIFFWGEETWRIPAAYACGKGLVVDFCVEIAPEKVAEWIAKWDLFNEDRHNYTDKQRRQIEQENPLETDFRATVTVNGNVMRQKRGNGMCWIADSCLNGEERNRTETQAFLEHYSLDKSRCWSIHRTSFPWATSRKPAVKTIELHLKREMTNIPGICFKTPAVGDCVSFTHPITGVEHTITVQEYEPQEMDASRMPDKMMEYPTHYHMMTYTLEPEIPARNFMLQDCVPSDEPRIRQVNFSNQVEINGAAACIGIISGSDGPTAIIFTHGEPVKPHATCSSLRFEPVQEVEWQITFREKLLPDLKISLL